MGIIQPARILQRASSKGIEAYLIQCGSSLKELPECAGKYKGRSLIICADGACVWDDLERFGCRNIGSGRGSVWKSGWDFMTVNKMVETFPGDIEHCYSNEPQTLLTFMAARRTEYKREFNAPQNSHSISPGVKWRWPFGGHGTSGLGSVLVAVGLGYGRIVVCGMPLDNSHHNGEPPWRKCHFESSEASGSVATGENSHWKTAWELAFEGKVRSMSGRTKKWLGDAVEWG